MKKVELCEIEQYLKLSNPEPECLRKRHAEAWIVDGGYLVTEVLSDELFIWCYEGRAFMPFVRKLAQIALNNNLRYVGWFTRHIAPLRLCRDIRGSIEFGAD